MFRSFNLLAAIRSTVNWIAGSFWRTFIIIFSLSIFIRLNQLNQIPARYLIPTNQWELGSIAISLMKTGQFADPYMIATGPTAHLPPIYPFIFSLIYRWFGLTATAGYAGWLFIIASGSLLYAMLPWFSAKLGTGKQAGLLGGLAAALLVEWTGHGEYPTAFIMGLLLVSFLRRWTNNHTSNSGSFLLGLAIGVAFHLQPALLPVILGCIIFELWWSRNSRKWILSGILLLGIFLACLPWAWRNYTTFNTFFFIRSNLGLELRMGNHDGAAASMEVMDAQAEHIHPRTHFAEARKLRDIGEIAYMQEAQQEALQWIITHPAKFLWLTLQRFANLWAGPLHLPSAASGVLVLSLLTFFGFWRSLPTLSIPQRAALLIPLLTYPLIYYIVAYMPRYRVPIDWILYILAGAAIWHFLTRAADASLSQTNSTKSLAR